ncbi:rhomboid family intramembrane serine protease [Rhizobium sp. CRIBSB]|nr:rhomboid family intramembrane serine protease [Rhizobium sp. CRIBSB]
MEAELDQPIREPAIRLPWQTAVLALILVAVFAAQLGYGQGDPRPAARAMGLVPHELWSRQASGVFTHVLVHAGWSHLAFSVAGVLILGTPLARRMPGRAGFLGLLTFFLLSGALGGLVFAAVSPGSDGILVGASAGVSGLLAAATRLVRRRQGVDSLLSPLLLAIGLFWLTGNLLAALTDMVGRSAFSEYGWQAHVGGFVAGALLTGPWIRLFGHESNLRPGTD